MPWTVKDVDNFKKGLTSDEKKKWVSIANGALKNCLEKGGEQSDCEAKAIKIANSRVDANGECFRKTFTANISDIIQRKTHDGREYLVVPVVLICEGVHNAVYYSPEELGMLTEQWNGRPVVVYHPTKRVTLEDGEEETIPISANEPSVDENQTIGKMFNVHFAHPKLKGEAWIDIEKANKVDTEVMRIFDNEERMEVSTGMFQFEDNVAGEWKDKEYSATAHDIRPDHLAFLPNQKGACSWEDGGGAPRINQASGDNDMKDEEYQELKQEVGSIKGLLNKVLGRNKKHTGDETMDKEKFVAELIANESTKWTEDHKETLMGLDEDVLKSLKPEVVDNSEEVEAKDKEIADLKAKVEKLENEKPEEPKPAKTFDELAENASDEMRDALNEMKKAREAKRAELVEKITANEANPYSEEQLKAKNTDELEALSKFASGTNYSARQQPRDNAEEGDEPDYAPTVSPFAKSE